MNRKHSLKISDTWRKQVPVPWTYTDSWPRRPTVMVQELCKGRGGRPGLSVLTTLLSGFRGRKVILNHASALVSACPEYVNWHLRTLSNTTYQRPTADNTCRNLPHAVWTGQWFAIVDTMIDKSWFMEYRTENGACVWTVVSNMASMLCISPYIPRVFR